MIRLVQLLPIDILSEVAKSGAEIPKLTIGNMEKEIIKNSSGNVGPHSTNYRVSNLKDITDKKFVNIIKKAFPPVKKVDVIDSGVGDNKSGAFKLFKWTWGKKDYKVHLAGNVAGRGTKQTRDQELSWLLVLSGMQYLDKNAPSDKENFLSILMETSVWSLVDGVTQTLASELVSFLHYNDDWYKSHVKQCKKLIQTLGVENQPKKYVKDSSSLSINKQAKKLYNSDSMASKRPKWSLDKWNPADVWLEYKSPPEFKSLAELNNYLYFSLKRGEGYVGVSLKKGGGSIGIVNDWAKKPYTVTDLTLNYGYLFSQGMTCIYSGQNLEGLGLAFRIFQGKVSELIRGEGTSKSADAVQGKVALHVLDTTTSGIVSAVDSVKGESVKYVKDPNGKKKTDKIWEWTPNGLSRFNGATGVQSAYKTVKGKGAKFDNTKTQGIWSDAFKSSDKFIEAVNNWKTTKKENSIKANISSRFQTLVLGSKLMGLGKKKREEVMLGLLQYGKSESEWSAPHYKAQ